MLGIVLADNFELQNSPWGDTLTGLTIPQIISTLLIFILVVAAVVFFLMLIIGGIKWILSGGDKAQAESARNQITAALIGLVIIFAAWAIANLLSTFFGINLFENLSIPTVGGTS